MKALIFFIHERNVHCLIVAQGLRVATVAKARQECVGALLAPMLKNNTDLVIAGIAPKSTKHAPKFAALHRQWRRLSISEIFSN